MGFDSNPIYYVYVFFDAFAIPRWIGKGKGSRMEQSLHDPPKMNRMKAAFITRTRSAIGDVPRLKIRENLPEAEAFIVEQALIKAIGRYPNGPLVNLIEGGSGASRSKTKTKVNSNPGLRKSRSEPLKRYWATVDPEQCSFQNKVNATNGWITRRRKYGKCGYASSQRSERGAAAARTTWIIRRQKYGPSGYRPK